MTTFLLIRHAVHELGGETIAGRTPGVRLSPEGRKQAAELTDRLAGLPIRTIYSSPLDRTRETAAIIGDRLALTPIVREEINELEFGDWSGTAIADLRPQEQWSRFNSFRSGIRAPGGELMPETQLRMVRFMIDLRKDHPDEMVAIVSHGDVIKSALAYFLGVPLDLLQRIEISPASVSVACIADYGPWVLCVNHTGTLPIGC